MKLCIRKFDPSTIKPHRIMLIVGRRGTGKSVLQQDMMFHTSSKVDFGIAMSPTEEAIQTFRRSMPEAWIYRQYNGEKLEDMIRVQRKCLEAGKTPKSLFLVLDDCLYDKKILKSQAMRELFMNGRHLRISFNCAAQYMMDLGPDLRTNVDYVIATREMIIANKVKLWRYFYGMIDKFEDFSRIMNICTENYSVLVIDNTKGSNNIEDCIFWYRADPNTPQFKMGQDMFWKLSQQYVKTDQQRAVEREYQAQIEKHMQSARRKKEPLVVQVADERGNAISNSTRPNTSIMM